MGGKKPPAESSEAEPAKKPGRGKGRPFEKGKSPNPGGLSAERREFLAMVRREEEPYCRAVLEKLREFALLGKPWAITDYLDRLGVRMPEKLELTGEDGAPVDTGGGLAAEILNLTSEQVRKKLEAVRAEREALLAGATNGKPGGGA